MQIVTTRLWSDSSLDVQIWVINKVSDYGAEMAMGFRKGCCHAFQETRGSCASSESMKKPKQKVKRFWS